MRKLNRENDTKLGDMNNEDIFSLLQEHMKRSIKSDLESMYGKTADLLNSKEPWFFQVEEE